MTLLNNNTELWLAFGSVVAALILCLLAFVRSRTRTNGELQALSDKYQKLSAAFEDYVVEAEKIAQELSRRIKAERTAPAATEAKAKSQRNGIDKKYHVLNLFKRGATVDEIAEKLRMPQGEIQLILNLYRGMTPVAARAQ